eukprot:COSAG06_NODE_9469_length_1892_cov_2.765756_1_plen_290_part_00
MGRSECDNSPLEDERDAKKISHQGSELLGVDNDSGETWNEVQKLIIKLAQKSAAAAQGNAEVREWAEQLQQLLCDGAADLADGVGNWKTKAAEFNQPCDETCARNRWKDHKEAWMEEFQDLANAVNAASAKTAVIAVTFDIIECYVSDATPDKVVKGASAQAVLDSAEKLYVAEHGGDETVEKIHLKRSRGAKLPAESGIPGVVFHRIDVDNKAGSFLKTVHTAMLEAFMCPGYTGFSDAATLAGTGEIGLRRLTAAQKKRGMRAPKNGDYSTSWINRIYQHLMNKADV